MVLLDILSRLSCLPCFGNIFSSTFAFLLVVFKFGLAAQCFYN